MTLLVILLGLCASAFFLLQGLQPCDDAYIAFRHTRNLLEHFRLAWNTEGKPVLGSTTPAFVITLGIFCKAFFVHSIDQAALALNALFLFFIVVFSFLIMKDLLEENLPALFGAGLAGFDSVCIFTYSQVFEAAMLTFVLLVSLFLLRKGRTGFSILLGSVAPLIRPEGILLAPLFLLYLTVTRSFRWRLLLIYLVIPVVWLFFSIHYYGSAIPNTIIAKKKFGAIYFPYNGAEVKLTERFSVIIPGAIKLLKGQAGSMLLDGGPLRRSVHSVRVRIWVAAVGFLWMLLRMRRMRDALYLGYPVLFLLLYSWIGYVQYWYYPSFITLSIIVIYYSCCLGIRDGLSRIRQTPKFSFDIPGAKAGLYFLIFFIVITGNRYNLRINDPGFFFADNPLGSEWEQWEPERYETYRKAAEYLNARARRREVALIPEVGVFGYFYKGEVLDSVGLCSPEALRFYPPPRWDIYDPSGHLYTRANNFVPTNMVLTLKPTYLVASDLYISNLLKPESAFLKKYDRIAYVGKAWGRPVLIFELKEHRNALVTLMDGRSSVN